MAGKRSVVGGGIKGSSGDWLILVSILVVMSLLLVASYYLVQWRFGSLWNYIDFGWQVFKLFLLYLGGLVGVVIAILLGLFALSRQTPVRVFVSHHHRDETMALTLLTALRGLGVRAEALTVEPRAHDDVVSWVREHLESTHALVAIPPRTDQSFANAEILAASILRKPIMLVVDGDDRQLPDTALSGYPVFRYDKLSEKGFVPIATFLNYLFFHRSDVIPSLGRSVSQVGGGFVVLYFLFGVASNVFNLLVFFFDPKLAINVLEWWYRVTFVAATALLLVGLVMAARKKMRARRLVRQQTITGRFSRESLTSSLGKDDADADVLNCLETTHLQGNG